MKPRAIVGASLTERSSTSFFILRKRAPVSWPRNPALAAAGAAAAAASAWFGYLGIQALHAGQAFVQFRDSINFTGAVALTDAEMRQLSEGIRSLSGVTQAEAEKIVASLGGMQNQSKAAFDAIVSNIPSLATASDIKPEQAATESKTSSASPSMPRTACSKS